MTLDSRTTTRSDLEGKHLPELHQMAQTMGVSGYQRLRKGDLIVRLPLDVLRVAVIEVDAGDRQRRRDD